MRIEKRAGCTMHLTTINPSFNMALYDITDDDIYGIFTPD